MSSKFSRRPRIQPLPPVCRASPVTTSCYEKPTEPPEPMRMTLEGRGWNDGQEDYGTWSADMTRFRETDYSWRFEGQDNSGFDLEVVVWWNRATSLATVDVYTNNPFCPTGSFNFPQFTLTDAWPWMEHLIWDEPDEPEQHVEVWLSN